MFQSLSVIFYTISEICLFRMYADSANSRKMCVACIAPGANIFLLLHNYNRYYTYFSKFSLIVYEHTRNYI